MKRYGASLANDHIDFDVRPGEIHALLGENGAGKTTLMSVAFGLVRPDEGTVRVGGERVSLTSPHDALEHGIGMVHQHFMLVPGFTVAENVALGSMPATKLRMRWSAAERDVERVASQFSMQDLRPETPVGDLPIDMRQRVEILKLLYRKATILILDEPTAVLGPPQISALFATLRELRASNRSIVVVTHKLSEVMEVADRVSILKQGRKTVTMQRGEFDEQVLARAMTGRELSDLSSRSSRSPKGGADGPVLLRVRRLSMVDARGGLALNRVDLDVRAGEILGVAGVEGNGQSELVSALAGVATLTDGTISVRDVDVTGAGPGALHEAGVSVVPEDRHASGLVLDMTLADNLALAGIPEGEFSRWGLLQRRAIRSRAQELLHQFDVRPPDPGALASSLSGGNQQKVVLARELARDPHVLVAAYPTRGLDVGATELVHELILDVARKGRSVVLVSHDLDELLQLSDQVIVLFRGEIAYETSRQDLSMDRLAIAMTGGRRDAGVANGEVDA